MSLPSNPMFDAAQTGEIPRVAQAFEPDAFTWPKMPARLQTMMLPNGRWLLVMDNASEVERLDVDRERLIERTGAVDVLSFVGPVEVVEAYPEPVVERDEQLVGKLRVALKKLGESVRTARELDAAQQQLADVRLLAERGRSVPVCVDILAVLGDTTATQQGDGVVIPPQRVA